MEDVAARRVNQLVGRGKRESSETAQTPARCTFRERRSKNGAAGGSDPKHLPHKKSSQKNCQGGGGSKAEPCNSRNRVIGDNQDHSGRRSGNADAESRGGARIQAQPGEGSYIVRVAGMGSGCRRSGRYRGERGRRDSGRNRGEDRRSGPARYEATLVQEFFGAGEDRRGGEE